MISLFIFIGVILLIAWAITVLIPMPSRAQTVVWIIAILLVVLLVLRATGLLDGGDVDVPRVRVRN